MPSHRLAQALYRRVTGEAEIPACQDISPSAQREQPGNYALQLLSLAGTKLADELASVRLVLPWALGAVGAPVWMVAWLIPLRDGGALIPQLVLGAWVRGQRRAKVAWALGGVLQGVSAVAMAWTVWAGAVSGVGAGWCLLGALAVLSVARALSSISMKVVLGKTIARQRRGSVSGWSGSAASAIGMAVGLVLSLELVTGEGSEVPDGAVLGILLLGAAGGWGFSALCTAAVREEDGGESTAAGAMQTLRDGCRALGENRRFLWFNVARVAALGSALALPYLTVLSRESSGTSLRDLGVLVIAAGVGGALSSPFWGRFANSASHKVMAMGAGAAAVCATLAAGTVWLPDQVRTSVWPYAILYTLALMAHGGIRVGRGTHVVNLATPDERALLVATTNSLVGLVILPLGALTGAMVPWLGVSGLLLVFAGMAAVAAGVAWSLPPAEAD